jgi:hypothetical protein
MNNTVLHFISVSKEPHIIVVVLITRLWARRPKKFSSFSGTAGKPVFIFGVQVCKNSQNKIGKYFRVNYFIKVSEQASEQL